MPSPKRYLDTAKPRRSRRRDLEVGDIRGTSIYYSRHKDWTKPSKPSPSQTRARHREIARQYITQAPTFSNLYNAADHFLQGIGIAPTDESQEGLIMGTPPVPGFSPKQFSNLQKTATVIRGFENAVSGFENGVTAGNVLETSPGIGQVLKGGTKGISTASKIALDKLGFFVKKPNSFTRGIGGELGLDDLIESGVIRGNPAGTETSAKLFGKMFRNDRNNFASIMTATGRKGIAQRWFNRSLSREDFDAIKKAARPYEDLRPEVRDNHITLSIYPHSDPLHGYNTYDDYIKAVREARKSLRGATTLGDDGQPLAYFYDDGRNPLTAGHDYAASKYGVRINNASDYKPFIHPAHLHYSMPRAVSLYDPNVEVFKRGLFGITRRMSKRKLALSKGLTNHKYGGSIHINPANRGKFTATMKRTGKTAEELSHSSNPLTRKRAIFALNARKWNH